MLVKRERLKVNVSPRAEMNIWEELRHDFSGLVNEVKTEYWNNLELPFAQSGESVPGDVFFRDNDAVLYYFVDTQNSYVEAGCMCPNGGGADEFSRFCQRIGT